MRSFLGGVIAVAVCAQGLAAQGSDVTAIAGPQFVSFTIGSGTTGKTVSQMSVPFAVIVPLGEKFSFDVSGAWAKSAVSSNGVQTSSINGLTDTQARFNWTLGDNFAVVTLGANIATGQYKVGDAQQEAAGQDAQHDAPEDRIGPHDSLQKTWKRCYGQTAGTQSLGQVRLGAGGIGSNPGFGLADLLAGEGQPGVRRVRSQSPTWRTWYLIR